MKQTKFLFGMAVASVMLGSCSNDENYDGAPVDQNGQQIISLAVDNGGDAFRGSRAAERPLFGSEAKQNIDKVSLWICDGSNKVVYAKTLVNWNSTGSEVYETGGHGRQAKLVIAGEDRLAEGTYTVYAIGYSSEGKTYAKAEIPAKGSQFDANQFIATSNTGLGAEIFATSSKLEVKGGDSGKGFKSNVVLHRQVAGIYAYLENIPYDNKLTQEATLVIEASQKKNYQLVFGAFAPTADLENNGKNERTNTINAGRSASSTTDNVVATIKLSEWLGAIVDNDKDGVIDIDGWKNPYATQNVDFVKGSVFVGQFIQPFKKNDNTNTFVMYLTTNGETKTQYHWNIKLAANNIWNGQITEWTNGEFKPVTEYTEDAYKYSVYRNHLYAIGKKVHDKNPEGPEVNPEPDKPVDISKTQELTLKVNDNWEMIHDMEVE